MTADLQFRPLKAPLSNKQLLAWRKDAEMEGATPQNKAHDPRGKVQWVSVEAKGKQIGIARLELAPPEFCFVSELIISSKFRRQGIGHWFLNRIEQYCLSQSIRRLVLEAREGTDSFYKSQLFINDPYLPHLLKKDINPFQRKVFSPLYS
ncbi:GNAT family N-acetyltransferase [Duganella aceris]|jgi:GNAT superfamily N-acetyltransferase|uniref:GNAT family N-acetyltransferase n=1 Tax=Duganella aceris TaxID=2703883 RepID=A0ABX0FGX3_9BURK|nr:GNAT family N-acetyltransferase [Duganella aceris]NGZ83806.1 GNAT family N-acetyltransferase [Duganella aceris]